MDIIKSLPDFLDIGVEEEEMKAVALNALAKRLNALKAAIAETLLGAKAQALTDNFTAQHEALKQAKALKKEYHHFYAEFNRLQKGEEENWAASDEDNA